MFVEFHEYKNMPERFKGNNKEWLSNKRETKCENNVKKNSYLVNLKNWFGPITVIDNNVYISCYPTNMKELLIIDKVFTKAPQKHETEFLEAIKNGKKVNPITYESGIINLNKYLSKIDIGRNKFLLVPCFNYDEQLVYGIPAERDSFEITKKLKINIDITCQKKIKVGKIDNNKKIFNFHIKKTNSDYRNIIIEKLRYKINDFDIKYKPFISDTNKFSLYLTYKEVKSMDFFIDIDQANSRTTLIALNTKIKINRGILDVAR